MLKLEQQGIERALVEDQNVSADLLDAAGDDPNSLTCSPSTASCAAFLNEGRMDPDGITDLKGGFGVP
jgi:hypothetical protein